MTEPKSKSVQRPGVLRHIKTPVHLAGAELDLIVDDNSSAVCLADPWGHATDPDALAAELVRVINGVEELMAAVEEDTEVREAATLTTMSYEREAVAMNRLAIALAAMQPPEG